MSGFPQEKRGKVWKPKEEPVTVSDCQDEDLKTDFDDVLNQATEEELVDLAGECGTRCVAQCGASCSAVCDAFACLFPLLLSA